MIEYDCETTGLQPYSGRNEAFLWIFLEHLEDPRAWVRSPNRTQDILNYIDHVWAKDDPAPWAVIKFFPMGRRQHPIKARDVLYHIDHAMAQDEIQSWFDRAKADPEGIRCWNTKFDRAFADNAGCFDIPGDGKWHDGMLDAHAIDERRSVALKAVASQLFGDSAADDQKRLKNWLNAENRRRQKKAREQGLKEYERANYSHVPDDIIYPYGLEDVVLTRKVGDVYGQRLAQIPDLAGLVEFERKALDALYGIEKRGLPADELGYRKLEQEVLSNMEMLEDKIKDIVAEADPIIYAKELAGDKWSKDEKYVEADEDGNLFYTGGAAHLDDFAPNSTAKVLAALKARGANMKFMSVQDGKVSADADNLRAVDDELAVAILNFRAENKVLTTYVRPMIGRSYVSAMNVYKEPFIAPDGRIHATYRQVGARTGRMSCADPNMQNQPRDDLRLRYNIVADEGHSLVCCDLSNIEMVLFAAYCGQGRLLTAVQNGEDLHVLTAKMLGLRDRKRAGGGIETARQLGKTYNFSRIYGGGLRTIRRSFRCSLDEAKLYKKRFDDAYPEVAKLANRIQYRLEDDGYIQASLISNRRFRVDPRDAYKATNYLVQGTAADLLKEAVSKLHIDGVPMVALVHDEVVAHVRNEDAQEVANLIEKRMTECEGLKGIVPLRAEADIVKRWSDAKPLKDDAGPYLFTPQWAGGERRRIPAT